MTAEEIAHVKALKQSGLWREAAQFYQKILKTDPDDKLAKLGYAQCLTKEGLKENLKPLLLKAEKLLFELIETDPFFTQAHDELIFLSHKLDKLGELSDYYNDKLKKYPSRKIYTDCLKKISGIAYLVIPRREINPRKMPLLAKLLLYFLGIFFCTLFILSLSSPKFKFLFFPTLFVIVGFIAFGILRYIFSPKEKKW